MAWRNVITFIDGYRQRHPANSKEALVAAVAQEFRLTRRRAVYACDGFAIRFSEASKGGFSNTVASLARLAEFDTIPFIVAVVRPDRTDFLLANSTFLKKVSHSSQIFSASKIRGSFNGSDIIRVYEGLENCPDNFDQLLAIHLEFTWQENLERLAGRTSQIVATGRRFVPTEAQREAILRAPGVAAALIDDREYSDLKKELSTTVAESSLRVLESARIDSSKQRGDSIERILTGRICTHNLADMVRRLAGGVEMHIEIKTKLIDRASSNPKAFNIDKALELLARSDTLMAYCLVGIDLARSSVSCTTLSIFDRTVVAATRTQSHWSGRNSRGATQLTGDFARVLAPGYRESIDVGAAIQFLENLLAR